MIVSLYGENAKKGLTSYDLSLQHSTVQIKEYDNQKLISFY